MRWLLFLCILSLWACQEKKEAPFPLPIEEFPAILLDVHYAESAMQNLYGETKDSMVNVYYDQICEIHGISRDKLEDAMDQLRKDPDQMLIVYNQMMDLIAEREAQSKSTPSRGED